MKTATAITTVKRNGQLREWAEQIKAQQESGMYAKIKLSQLASK